MSVLDIFKKNKKKEEERHKKELEAKKSPRVKTSSDNATDKTKEKKADKGSDTGDAYRVLLRPMVTEKSADLGVLNQYIFEVATDANKIEVKKAIYNVYGVKPVKVRIISMIGKSRRFGRVRGKTKNWKKAIITLKQGDRIEIYEGV